MVPHHFQARIQLFKMPPKTLLDLASTSSSNLISVTHPTRWTPPLSGQFPNTRPVLLLGPGASRSLYIKCLPPPVPLPADACSSLKTHLNHRFPTPGLDQALWWSHCPLLQLQSHNIVLESKGIQVQVWEFSVGRRACIRSSPGSGSQPQPGPWQGSEPELNSWISAVLSTWP